MRGTLSQSSEGQIATHRAATRRARRSRSIAFGLSILLCCLGGSGCQESADGGPGGPGSSGHFEWPEDPSHPVVRIEVDGAAGTGVIEIELVPELAPVTVAQITEWVDEGYYDGTTFHRVIKDFIVQGGDPNSRDERPGNDGQGGSEVRLASEFSDAPFDRGVVAMANRGGKKTTGSQFFIVQSDAPALVGYYTVVGRVRSGMEVVDAIAEVEIDRAGRWGPKDRPIENVVMTRVSRLDSTLAASAP